MLVKEGAAFGRGEDLSCHLLFRRRGTGRHEAEKQAFQLIFFGFPYATCLPKVGGRRAFAGAASARGGSVAIAALTYGSRG